MLACKKCTSPRVTVHARTVHCNSCGHTENVNTMIQRSMKPAQPQSSTAIASPHRNEAYTQLGPGCFQKRAVRYA